MSPLFVCDSCDTIDNTALARGFWKRRYEGKPWLCSECLHGEWHGHFDRWTLDTFPGESTVMRKR